MSRRTVEVRGAPVTLTYVEFELLRTLAASPGRVFSRRMLLEALWKSADYRDPRTIDVHVRHLREKLEAEPREPEYILTVRGVGYRFRDQLMPFRSVGSRLALALLVIVVGRARDRLPDRRPVVPALAREPGAAQSRLVPQKVVLPKFPAEFDLRAQYVNEMAPVASTRASPSSSSSRRQRAARAGCRLESRRAVGAISRRIRSRLLAYKRGQLARGIVDAERRAVRRGGRTGPSRLARRALLAAPRTAPDRRASFAAGCSSPAASRPSSPCSSGMQAPRLFARRLRRLEQAAERIAAGDFEEPVVDARTRRGRRAGPRVRAHAPPARARSTALAASSSPTPRMSCARRSSRSAAFSSCSRSRSSIAATREEFLESMREQVARLAKLATELLDLSRLDAGPPDAGDRDRRPGRARGRADCRVHPSRHGDRARTRRRVRRAGRGARRRRTHPPDRPRPRRERARPHAGRDAGPARRVAGRPPGAPDGRERRSRHPARGAAAGVRALLPARRRQAPPAAGSDWRSRASSRP